MAASDILSDNQKHSTIAGLLIFGISPEPYLPASGISFAHFAGDVIDEKRIDKQLIKGTLDRQVDNCLATIYANILTGSTLLNEAYQCTLLLSLDRNFKSFYLRNVLKITSSLLILFVLR